MMETQTERRGHDFLPKGTSGLAALYDTEDIKTGDKLVALHYFIGGSHWYLCEVDAQETRAFGWCVLGGDTDLAEWGYVSLEELEQINIRGNIVERDLNWEMLTARECLPSVAWKWQD